MRAAMIKARSVLAVSVVCFFALALLVPAANAQVTVKHIKVTLSPASGGSVTAIYCDYGTTCTGGIQIWDLSTPVLLNGGQTLVLTQTGRSATNPPTIPPVSIALAPNAGNFDTSDRINPGATQLQDCGITPTPHSCRVKIELMVDAAVTFTTVYDDLGAGDALSKFNSDEESAGTTVCEGAAYTTRYTAANFTLGTGYADNVHTPACNTFPTPFAGATVFKGAGTPAQGGCASNCYDAGVIVITGIEVPHGCTYTWGFWKNHGYEPSGNNENLLPASVKSGGVTLGTVNYTQAQIQLIFDKSVAGNGLISLAHQLLAAKINIANGASGSAIAATITAADALIGGKIVPPIGSGYLSPGSVSALVDALTAFNEGTTGPGHCAESDSDTD